MADKVKTTVRRRKGGGTVTTRETQEDQHASQQADQSKKDAILVHRATRRFEEFSTDANEQDLRKDALDDLKFRIGGRFQWDPKVLDRRDRRHKPVITVNRIKPAVRQVTGDQRQNRGSIKVNPADEFSDVKTAEIIQGIVRHIEANSMADIAYDTAGDAQVTHGFGVIKINTAWPTPMSMDQEIYIEPVKDPFKIYLGPHLKMDASDMDEAYELVDLDFQSYKEQFPESKFSKGDSFQSMGDALPHGWINGDAIRLAKYWERTYEQTEIHKLQSGVVITDAERLEYEARLEQSLVQASFDPSQSVPPLQIVGSRTTQIPHVKWYLINGVELLDSGDWAGVHIPLIPVYGEDLIVDGKPYRAGIVRDAKDAQRQVNFHRSTMSEIIGLASKTPWVMAEGQNEGRERMWELANVENYPVLFYKQVSLNQHLAPPPQRNNSEPPIQATLAAAIQYEDDIKGTTMVYDAKLGAKSNETSGVAINQRKQQGDTANYMYIDNLNRAIRMVGRQLIDLIPKIYDARQVVRIIGLDDEVGQAKVMNDRQQPARVERTLPDGKGVEFIYNLGVGQYDVVIGVGKPYLTKMQEELDTLTSLVNSYPEFMEVAGDFILKATGISGAEKVADRFREMVYMKYPNLRPPEEGQPNIPPVVRQQMEQMKQLLDATTKELQEAQKIIEAKTIEQQANVQRTQIQSKSNEEVAALNAQVELYKAELKAATDKMQTEMKAMNDQMNNQIKASSAETQNQLKVLNTMISAMAKDRQLRIQQQNRNNKRS